MVASPSCEAKSSRSGAEGRTRAVVGRIGGRMNSMTQILAQESSSGAAAVQFVILLMVPVALYFLMIRPQRKRMRETAALQAS